MTERPAMPPGTLDAVMQNATPDASQHAPDILLAYERTISELEKDEKSGLLKEGPWRERLQTTLDSLEPGERVVVTVTDANNFKPVNDGEGHEAGDELIGHIGQAFMEVHRRPTDQMTRGSRENPFQSAARLGGDENASFQVIKAAPDQQTADDQVPRTTDPLAAASTQMQHVNESLEHRLVGTKFEKYNISLSSGSAANEPGDTAETLFAKADMRMFENKYQGKIGQLTQGDYERLQEVIPFMNSIGARVEGWLVQAVEQFSQTVPADGAH